MIDFIGSSAKRHIRPLALPVWLRLQNNTYWKKIIHAISNYYFDRRSFMGFGVGLPKSGTSSLAHLLGENFRSRHEPETWILAYPTKIHTWGHK